MIWWKTSIMRQLEVPSSMHNRRCIQVACPFCPFSMVVPKPKRGISKPLDKRIVPEMPDSCPIIQRQHNESPSSRIAWSRWWRWGDVRIKILNLDWWSSEFSCPSLHSAHLNLSFSFSYSFLAKLPFTSCLAPIDFEGSSSWEVLKNSHIHTWVWVSMINRGILEATTY